MGGPQNSCEHCGAVWSEATVDASLCVSPRCVKIRALEAEVARLKEREAAIVSATQQHQEHATSQSMEIARLREGLRGILLAQPSGVYNDDDVAEFHAAMETAAALLEPGKEEA